MNDLPETYQERIRAQMREELIAEIRHEFAGQLVAAIKTAMVRDPSIQRIVELVEDMV